ncbi:class D beta-lactamase [Catalinimonas sp. 4WD22]|uniref:class D beta-lactamase n=1 Tax=Catalinimonas locisalis TaxID=3133978 RepID=UPI003100BC11
MPRSIIIILLYLGIFSCTGNQERDLQKYFDAYEVKGSFILYDEARNEFIRYNTRRCNEAFSPASTFKIPNTLIALEEKILQDETSMIYWNGESWPVETWNQDLDLQHAFRLSCVPCYIQIASKIPEEKYQQYLSDIKYGNEDPSGSENNSFWLDGNLRINQEQQIDFLRKLYHMQLPVSERSMKIVKKILVEEKNDDFILSSKTGWNNTSHSKDVGWYVGYLEKDNHVYYFATNIESPQAKESFGKARKEITLNVLKALNITD